MVATRLVQVITSNGALMPFPRDGIHCMSCCRGLDFSGDIKKNGLKFAAVC